MTLEEKISQTVNNSAAVDRLAGIAGKVSPSTRMQYGQGALPTAENINDMDWFSGQAKDADATIVVLGHTLLLEGESIASPYKGDILDMKLPESQLVLLMQMKLYRCI